MLRSGGAFGYNPDSSVCAREDLRAGRNNDVKWLCIGHPYFELTWKRREFSVVLRQR